MKGKHLIKDYILDFQGTRSNNIICKQIKFYIAIIIANNYYIGSFIPQTACNPHHNSVRQTLFDQHFVDDC